MEIKVYSTSACPWCVRAKDFLKANNIEFKEIDVGADKEAAQEMIEKSGQMGVPVIIIADDGEETIIVGFNEAKLKELLKLE